MASKQRRVIEIAKNLSLDESTATETLGVLARKGRGKTFLASKNVEGLYRLNCPTTIIDPAGNWWGLTLAANGKDAGLPFVVLGGERGDLELAPESGQRLAEIVVQRRLNVVLDVSGFDDKDLSRFVGDFLETFRLCSQRHRQARMVVFEEAQLLAPQQFSGQMQRMLKGVERIVRLGRNYGIGSMLISQRPQSVNKEVLSQVECLFVGQINEAHARKAVRDWIAEKDVDVKNQLDQLSKLERGEFFCWSPSWLQMFRKVRVLPKWTFDASRTPVLGEGTSEVEPRRERLTGDELAALREALGGSATPATSSGTTEDVVKERELRRQAEEGWRRASQEAAQLREQEGELRRALTALHERLGAVLQALHPSGVEERLEPPKATPVRAEGPRAVRGAPSEGDRRLNGRAKERDDGRSESGLDKCQRAILTVLAQQRKSLSKARLALMAGYSPNSGGFNNALSKLRTAGRIDGRGEVAATALGLEAAGRVPPLPEGAELFEYWLRHPRLDKCCRAIVTALRAQNGAVGKEELGTLTGYSATSGGFNNALSKLRTLGLIQGRGAVELVQDLY
jgi:hypothetical protein